MKMTYPKVSVIIICERWNDYLAEALPHHVRLDYPDYEVLAFLTEKPRKSFPGVRIIADPKTKNRPAEKRDLALKYAKGEIFAFIDEDAYPSRGWLKAAVKHFRDPRVAAVGGPGVNPPQAPLLERASGWVLASPLGGSLGNFGVSDRFIPQKMREVDDWPSMNLLVRAADFRRVGGFDSAYFPGEDTKLCLDLTQKLGKKIIYDPEVLVYHHKRKLFYKHLVQQGRCGCHRGNFARKLPETSRRWYYFIPSLFVGGLIAGPLLYLGLRYPCPWLAGVICRLYLQVLGLYIVLLFLNGLWVLAKRRHLVISLLTIPGVFLTHVWYGLQFIRGYFGKITEDTYGRVGEG